jgi:mycothiol system anti-sigma-R factor
MSRCDRYRLDIQLYLDKELSDHDSEELRGHLQGCVACRQQMKADVELRRLIRRSKPRYIASDALRKRIMKTSAEHRYSLGDLPD